jgi:hypothetical protein
MVSVGSGTLAGFMMEVGLLVSLSSNTAIVVYEAVISTSKRCIY